jgi:uncharacterized RDD family membrane protein YckC
MRFRDLKKQKNKQHTLKSDKRLNYARFSDRIKALITDMFMIYIPILYMITYVVLDGKDDFQSSQLAPLIGVTLYGIIYAILTSKFGQTPGKKAYTIKVVDDKTHKNITTLRAIWRFIAFLFTATTLLGLFLPFYTKEKKALHDILANTIVLQIEN